MVAMPGRDRWGTIPAMVDDPTDVLARLEAALAKLDELRDTPLPCARIRAELLALPCQVLREQVESTARLARAAKAAVGQGGGGGACEGGVGVAGAPGKPLPSPGNRGI